VIEYGEVDHCCLNFSLLDTWLEEKGAQRRGRVGHGDARLARSRDIVREAMAHLADQETVFLHPRGVCSDCDQAWASLRDFSPAATPASQPGAHSS
jgi:hypothetical protein